MSQRFKEGIPGFSQTLKAHGLKLEGKRPDTLQVNLGRVCNQVCKHCHLSAGPGRRESMDWETMEDVLAFQERFCLGMVDITGGAPEMNPHLSRFIEKMAPLAPHMMFRSNLSALNDRKDTLMGLLAEHGVGIVASFPSPNEKQTDAQRGDGIFEKSIAALKALNKMGYGTKGSNLSLDLVSNPSGAFMPPSQLAAEKRFRKKLARQWGIEFHNLFTFANVPLGRFKTWLENSGNYETYLGTLHKNFNPCAVDGLMCRTLISVSWDGFVFDCDFNQAAGLHKPSGRIHIGEVEDVTALKSDSNPICVGEHCYACTAGAGFT